jgi:CRP-like cAMP-binding protein
MDFVTQKQIGNLILSALPEEEYNRLLPDLEPIKMEIGELIDRPYEVIEYVHFPQDSIVSSVTYLDDGTSVEAGVIGREGTTGIAIALSNTKSPLEVSVQIPGDCLRIKADRFKQALEDNPVLKRLVHRHIFAYIAQVSHVNACNAHHVLEKRLARWLLMCRDRVNSDTVSLTQDFMAQMLGVHRPGVTLVALNLKEAGIINYRRGEITICDRTRLEKASCKCYEAIKKDYDDYLKPNNQNNS